LKHKPTWRRRNDALVVRQAKILSVEQYRWKWVIDATNTCNSALLPQPVPSRPGTRPARGGRRHPQRLHATARCCRPFQTAIAEDGHGVP
jgi:hypothetical protein